MKKTMLTYKTLDRFESENITENYTAQELERVEFAAYVANMNACAHAEWTEADIYADFLRVLDIDKITVTPKTIEEEQEEQTMTIYEKMTAELEAMKNRSAWEKGVNAYALELVEKLEERATYEGRNPEPGAECREWMLNGAQDWSQYSWGGSALIYDGDIAERLCNPSELKKTRNGERKPNSREEWLDVQARALYQACNRVSRLYRSIMTA